MEIIVLMLDDALLAAVLARRNLLDGGWQLFAFLIAAFLGKEYGHVVVIVVLRRGILLLPTCG